MASKDKKIYAFVGDFNANAAADDFNAASDPNWEIGRHFQSLLHVPVLYDGLILNLAASAKDDSGTFHSQWWPKHTAEDIAAYKAQTGNKVFLAFGSDDNDVWLDTIQPLVPINTWVKNASTSLLKIIDQYKLDGVDIQYEIGIDDPKTNKKTFVEYMIALIHEFKRVRPELLILLAPFTTTLDHYTEIFKAVGKDIHLVHCTFPHLKGTDDIVQSYTKVAGIFGWDKIAVQVLTVNKQSTVDALGIVQGPSLFEATRQLVQKGLKNAVVWNCELSRQVDYKDELIVYHLIKG